MSQRSSPGLVAARLAAHAGITIADARHRRQWTLRELADRADVSVATIHNVEHGAPASLQTYSAIAVALGLEPRLDLIDPRRRAPTSRAEDPVHAAMGEAEARQLGGHGLQVAVDEPYQHFQFAGRADVLRGMSTGGPCSTSRTGRASRTSRRRSAATTRSASICPRSWRSGSDFGAASGR